FTDILHQYRKTQQQKTENKFLSSYHQNKPYSLFPVPCSLSKLADFIEGARYEFNIYFTDFSCSIQVKLVQ
ncbi:MAG: hypothetical protein QNJ08_02030, partial [Crocosphaera sp.]|nr:hypothetical protein [Crocosphaera sp.]